MKELRVRVRKIPKTRTCRNCDKEFIYHKKQVFCQDRCQWAYNARVRRGKKSSVVKYVHCQFCNEDILDNKRSKFCSRNCQTKFNHRKSGYASQKKSRGRSYESFINSLVQKNSRRECGLTKDMLIELFKKQNGLCAISNQEMTWLTGRGKISTNISVDRIDSSKGYQLENVQLVCGIVNIMKHTSSLDKLRQWCYNILRGSISKERSNNV